VVSDAGQRKAEEAAVQFETIRAVFRNTMTIASQQPTNVVTVLALKDADSFREFFPQFWSVKNNVHPAGLFYGADYRTYMAIRFDAGYEESYETIYHEYYHSLTIPYVPNIPLWVAEGMAEFFGHTQVMGKKTQIGQIDPNLLAYLQQQRMPLGVLMKV